MDYVATELAAGLGTATTIGNCVVHNSNVACSGRPFTVAGQSVMVTITGANASIQVVRRICAQ